LLKDATERLIAAGVDSAALDARLIVGRALGGGAERIIECRDEIATIDQRKAVETALVRRETREPLAQIFGTKEFWSLEFLVSTDVLTPRADSESTIELVCELRNGPDKHPHVSRILDLGTGSGCLLIALLSELPGTWGLGVDCRIDSISVARENAVRLGYAANSAFCVTDWAKPLSGEFDVIVSNPPYIRSDEVDALEPEVSVFEPREALVGGNDGLDAYRRVLPQISAVLADDGVLVLEFGATQANDVTSIAKSSGLDFLTTMCDLSGVERCSAFAKTQQYR
jgi:release factor glutamine methyltransferase